MQLAFQELEIKLMKDIQEIKTVLYDLHSKLLPSSSSLKDVTAKINSVPLTQNSKTEFKSIENNFNTKKDIEKEHSHSPQITERNSGIVKLKSFEIKNSHLKVNR